MEQKKSLFVIFCDFLLNIVIYSKKKYILREFKLNVSLEMIFTIKV